MINYDVLRQVEEIYNSGGNIMQFLNQMSGGEGVQNTKEAILISYDFQSGSYVNAYKKNPGVYEKYTKEISDEIKTFGPFSTILEAGVGEATTFKQVIKNLDIPLENCYGFDISWSRLKTGNSFVNEDIAGNANFFVADLSDIPLMNSSIDIVYTAHSIEPNGGYEKPILEELYRVAKQYLVLFEPDYEFANDDAKHRMESHGYIKRLADTAKELGYDVIKRELLRFPLNPLNPTSVIVIQKTSKSRVDGIFQCPVSKTKLTDCGEVFFAEQPRLMYPVIQGIPCLLKSQAILGSRYNTM